MLDINERNKLITENIPYVQLVAKKFYYMNMNDDLVNEGILGLIRAAETFDKNQNVKFLTYAKFWVFDYISKYVNKNNRLVATEHIDEIAEPIEIEHNLIIDIMNNNLSSHLDKLNSKEREIIEGKYLNDISLTEMGRRYNISKQRVSQIEKRALEKLRKELA